MTSFKLIHVQICLLVSALVFRKQSESEVDCFSIPFVCVFFK